MYLICYPLLNFRASLCSQYEERNSGPSNRLSSNSISVPPGRSASWVQMWDRSQFCLGTSTVNRHNSHEKGAHFSTTLLRGMTVKKELRQQTPSHPDVLFSGLLCWCWIFRHWIENPVEKWSVTPYKYTKNFRGRGPEANTFPESGLGARNTVGSSHLKKGSNRRQVQSSLYFNKCKRTPARSNWR